MFFFFFSSRRRHTRCSRDWSSDVCSSDLILDHDAAVLRQPLLADIEFGHDLDTAGDGVTQFQWRSHHGLQDAVDSEADAHVFLVRFDVNVARTALDRVGQNQVHQLDDGGFLGGALQIGEICLRFFRGQFKVSPIFGAEVLHHLFELFTTLGFAVELRDGLGNGRFRGDHRLHVKARHELDIVHGKDVSGVGHRDRKRGTDTRKRDNLIADGGVLGYQLDYGGIYLVELQVNGGNAILAGKYTRNFVFTDEAKLHQTRSEPSATRLLVFQGLAKLLGRDQAFFYQYFA